MGRPRNAERAAIAERRARVLKLRIEQVPYAEIARQLGITEAVADSDYRRAVEARRGALDTQREAAVAIEMAKLDAIEQAAWEVLRHEHIVIQHGKVVRINRKPVADDAPVLQAIDRLLKTAERRARLRGLDAPVKVEVDDARRAEIAKYAAELAAWVGNVDVAGAGTAAPGAEEGAGGDSPA
jgi:hypothetical protein